MSEYLTALRPAADPGRPGVDLAELAAQLRAAEEAYPDLRRQLRQARAGVERRLGLHQPTSAQQRNRTRVREWGDG